MSTVPSSDVVQTDDGRVSENVLLRSPLHKRDSS